MNQEAKEPDNAMMLKHAESVKQAHHAILKIKLSYMDRIRLIYVSKNPIRKFARRLNKAIFD